MKAAKLVASIFISVTLTSCSVTEKAPEPKKPSISLTKLESLEEVDKGPVSGGTLKLFSTEPDTLNPLVTNNRYVKDFLSLVNEGMVAIDAYQRPQPCLSDKWQCSSDGLTWTFHIRNDVKWHDGTPLTASDVEFTCNFIMNSSVASSYKYNLQNVNAFGAVDESSFRVLLKKPMSFTPELMSFPIIQKRNSLKEILVEAGNTHSIIGTGPYIFKDFNKGKYVRLEANSSWWGAKGETAGLPYIKNVEIKIYKSPDDAITAFQDKETDLLYVNNNDFEKYSARSDIAIRKFTGRAFDYLTFNQAKPILGSKNVRNAITAGIDMDTLLEKVLPDAAVYSDMPVLPGNWLEDTSPEVKGADQAEVEKLLKADGFKRENDGYYKSINGVRTKLSLELIVNDDNKKRIEMAQEIGAQLIKTGITVNVVPLKWDEVFNRTSKGKFDLLLTGIRVPAIPDISYLYSYPYLASYPNFGYRPAANIAGYFNADVTAYIDKIFSATDESYKKAMYKNIKEIIKLDRPYMGICFYNNALIFNKRLRGELSPNVWDTLSFVERWYIPNQ